MTPSNVWMFRAKEAIEKHGLYTIVDGDPHLLHKRLSDWTRRNKWTGYRFAQDLKGGVIVKRVLP